MECKCFSLILIIPYPYACKQMEVGVGCLVVNLPALPGLIRKRWYTIPSFFQWASLASLQKRGADLDAPGERGTVEHSDVESGVKGEAKDHC